MRYILIALLHCTVSVAVSQTISVKDLNKVTTTELKDTEVKGKIKVLDSRPELLGFSVKGNKEFTGTGWDAENKEIPLQAVPGYLKRGTALLSFVPNSLNHSGNYLAGTATSEKEIIQANVSVSSAGFFTAVTDINNGIFFYGSGYLEAGQQVISLRATGIPRVSGIFKYTIGSGGISSQELSITFAGIATNEAVFSIEKNAGACALYKLEGDLTEGKALLSVNKITLKVKSTAAGHYTIRTTPVNGYFYSANGELNASESKDIILSGNGIPQTSGTNSVIVTYGGTTCEQNSTVAQIDPDFFDYNVPDEVVKAEFTDPAGTGKYTIQIPPVQKDEVVDEDENTNLLTGGAAAFENAILKTYGEENLILTPYGLMMNTKTLDGTKYIYGGANYVHIFLDEMGNSLITGIPQGMPEVQYVVHIIYTEKASNGKTVSYGIKTTRASFTGVNRIENNRATSELTSSSKPGLREYTLVIRTADSDIDFEVYRFEAGKQTGNRLTYTIPMTRSFTANISVGLLNTWLRNPSYSLETDPTDAALQVAKQTEGNNRGFVTVFATLYTSPITLLKYYINRKQIAHGKKLSSISNPVNNAQLHSKNYLYMRPVWERIYPAIGVGISDKIFQNLFFGLNWEFARGGSFFAGGHYGRVNVFNAPPAFEFEKNNITETEFNLYSNRDWKVAWTIGASIDFAIIGNLFK